MYNRYRTRYPGLASPRLVPARQAALQRRRRAVLPFAQDSLADIEDVLRRRFRARSVGYAEKPQLLEGRLILRIRHGLENASQVRWSNAPDKENVEGAQGGGNLDDAVQNVLQENQHMERPDAG